MVIDSLQSTIPTYDSISLAQFETSRTKKKKAIGFDKQFQFY